MTSATEPVGRDPWEQYGLAFSAVWLVFLVFPLVSLIAIDRPWPVKLLGLLTLVVFGAVYVHGFHRFGGNGAFGGRHPHAPAYLVVMVALIAVESLVIGVDSLGMTAFVVSFAMFTLPLAAAFALAVATVGFTAVLLLVLGRSDSFFFVLIVLLVGVTCGALRVLLQRGAEHDAEAAEMSLVTERERVARDVHDVLGHSLTVVTVKAELAARLVDVDPERARQEMLQVGALSREALGEVRATVGGLRVARLPDELVAAGSALTAAGIATDVHGDAADVDPRHRLVLAWVLRELVTNVVRHSGASRCELRLANDSMVVLDDGRGVERDTEGNGLRGVRERIAATGGQLLIGVPDSGTGTRAEVRL